VTGTAVLSAYGPGTETLLWGVLSGRSAFAPVQRFDVSARRAGFAAAMAGSPQLDAEVARAVSEACDLAVAGDGLDRGAALLVTRPDRNVPITA
jgi:3-oxoacyl-[acyl-carrier-protein] synthase II